MSDLGIAMQSSLRYIGDKLGIFRALEGAGRVTSTELAARSGLSEGSRRCTRFAAEKQTRSPTRLFARVKAG